MADVSVIKRPLEAIRCQRCKALLCKATPRPIRDGEAVELKCRKCDSMNFLIGGPVS